MPRFPLTLGLTLCLGMPCGAQGLTPRLADAVQSSQPAVRSSLMASIRPTYWREGALVGGILGGALGAVAGSGLCGQSEERDKNCVGSTILGGLTGALILAIPGALIGGLFVKGGA